MGRTCSAYGRKRKYLKKLVGKSEGKIPLGKHGRKWEDHIQMSVTQIGLESNFIFSKFINNSQYQKLSLHAF
jgi:hypothetical protein